MKKAEHRRIDAFELWCWRRLLIVPWTARRSILKEISAGISLEGMMLKEIHSEGDQSWDFFGRNDAKAETPVLWPPDVES